jgi:putative ATPase
LGLFDEPDETPGAERAPLADRMRPRDLDEFVGQTHLLGPESALARAIEHDALRSLILWGPPGSGKTTLARIIARRTRARFVHFSAVTSGVREVRAVTDAASRERRGGGSRTILFVDEIHRFNKAQQDAFLPFVEDGTITLIGATTENPSFEINSALLSRSRVVRLERLSDDELVRVLRHALEDRERGLGALAVDMDDEQLRFIAARSQGDARAALNVLEVTVAGAVQGKVPEEVLAEALQRQTLYHDRAGEEHFNLTSALHKSLRESDVDASLYWLARLLAAGDDPLYVARRVVRFAAEDVGLADPQALAVALDAKDAYHFLGSPEGELALACAVAYCAMAPKSNAVYAAWNRIADAIAEGATDPVPLALRNAPTPLMKSEGYGRGYAYAHDDPEAVTDLVCLPERLAARRFYEPTSRGFEAELSARLARWRAAKARR